MLMKIHSQLTLKDIKKQFTESFTHLKLTFFIDKNEDGNLTADEQWTDVNVTLDAISTIKSPDVIAIHDEMTPAQLEGEFKNRFGVMVQVFRKRGNQWLMTSQTDHLSLRQLQEMAVETSQASPDSEIIDKADWQDIE
jgi:hypothetical protein